MLSSMAYPLSQHRTLPPNSSWNGVDSPVLHCFSYIRCLLDLAASVEPENLKTFVSSQRSKMLIAIKVVVNIVYRWLWLLDS